jgi:hypothetical protein
MSKKSPTSLQAKHALPWVAFFARVLLHSSVLLVGALFPCATPTLGLLTVAESEAPVDEDESSEELAISVRDRTRVDRDPPGSPLLGPVRGGLSLAPSSTASVTNSGHRLPNNQLAPLLC